MRYLRPIPRRLLPDQMLVKVANGDGTFGESRLVRHVRLEMESAVADDGHRSADAGHGRVFVDAASSEGAFEVPVGSRVTFGHGPSMVVRACKRCCVIRGQVHHWELVVA